MDPEEKMTERHCRLVCCSSLACSLSWACMLIPFWWWAHFITDSRWHLLRLCCSNAEIAHFQLSNPLTIKAASTFFVSLIWLGWKRFLHMYQKALFAVPSQWSHDDHFSLSNHFEWNERFCLPKSLDGNDWRRGWLGLLNKTSLPDATHDEIPPISNSADLLNGVWLSADAQSESISLLSGNCSDCSDCWRVRKSPNNVCFFAIRQTRTCWYTEPCTFGFRKRWWVYAHNVKRWCGYCLTSPTRCAALAIHMLHYSWTIPNTPSHYVCGHNFVGWSSNEK